MTDASSGNLQLLELHDVTAYKAIKSGAIFGQYIPLYVPLTLIHEIVSLRYLRYLCPVNFRILNFAWLSFTLFVGVGEVLVKRGNVSRFIVRTVR